MPAGWSFPPVRSFPSITVRAEAVACIRAGYEVFSELSFCAEPGRLLCIAGPNGAGKSSLLRMIAGLLSPAAGVLAFDGCGAGEAVAHHLGHADGLKSALRLSATLGFWAALHGGDPGVDEVAMVARRVGLDHALALPIGVLSAGQRRRAGLARLLIAPRPLWLLDEPTAALDRDGEALLGTLMADHLAAGGTIIAATHQDLPIRAHATLRLGG